jgi:hypothetical protein
MNGSPRMLRNGPKGHISRHTGNQEKSSIPWRPFFEVLGTILVLKGTKDENGSPIPSSSL